MALIPALTATAGFGAKSTQPDLEPVPLDSYTMVTGVVTSNGHPLSGVDVFALAWPNQHVLDTLQDEEPVDTDVLSQAITNSRGQFVLSVDPGTVSADYVGDGGQIDVELVVATDDHEVVWNFTATRADSEGSPPAAVWGNERIDESVLDYRSEESVGPVHLYVELGDAPSIVEYGNEPETWVDSEDEPLSAAAAAQAAQLQLEPRRSSLGEAIVPLANTCRWLATSSYKTGRTEQFVRAVGTIQGKPFVRQTTSSRHTLGIATQSNSGSGSQSGTLQRSTGVTADNHLGYNHKVYNRVNYRRYQWECSTTGRSQWRPHSFNSLNDYTVVVSSRPSWNHCSSKIYKSGSASKTQGSNVTYAKGVSLGVMSVSSKASFSSSTTIRWQFSGSGAKLCGSTSKGWVTAPQARTRVP